MVAEDRANSKSSASIAWYVALSELRQKKMVDPTPIKPSVIPPINWAAIFAVIAALIGGLHWGGTPPTPVVDKPPIVVQPPVVDTPPPVVKPDVAPPVTIVDGHGNTVNGSIDAGHQFTVTTIPDCTVTPVPSANQDADITIWSDQKFSATLRNGCKLLIVVSGATKPVVLSVTCNVAAQPPPIVNKPPVVVDTPPPPPPVVNTGPYTLVVVYDKIDSRTAEVLQSYGTVNQLKAKGHTWKPLLLGSTAQIDPQGKLVVAIAVNKGLAAPYLGVINNDGSVARVISLPASKDLVKEVDDVR